MHNMSYKDRGIMKWAPFDALVGFHGLLNDLKQKLGQIERPLLSDDDHETLNRQLALAVDSSCLVNIYYFKNGYIQQQYGHITKVDFVFKKIILDGCIKISANDMIAIACLS